MERHRNNLCKCSTSRQCGMFTIFTWEWVCGMKIPAMWQYRSLSPSSPYPHWFHSHLSPCYLLSKFFINIIFAKKGNIECLKYAHENGCNWTTYTTIIAASMGYLDVLQYLLKIYPLTKLMLLVLYTSFFNYILLLC